MLSAAFAAMLLSGFYTDAARRVVIQCVRHGISCHRDIGYIDNVGRFHPARHGE
jgi:hypothetical protein